jgi:hypothetical protein
MQQKDSRIKKVYVPIYVEFTAKNLTSLEGDVLPLIFLVI